MCRRDEIEDIYQMPLLDLVHRAAKVHRMHHDPRMVQKCTLLSIKTGGCPEDCNYCSQSSKHSAETGTKATKLMELDEVYEAAVRAKQAGSTRFCMGAAWRGPGQVRASLIVIHCLHGRNTELLFFATVAQQCCWALVHHFSAAAQ